MTPVLYLYNAAFQQFDFSYAAAVGVILFVIILAATLVQRRLFGQDAGMVSRTTAVTATAAAARRTAERSADARGRGPRRGASGGPSRTRCSSAMAC